MGNDLRQLGISGRTLPKKQTINVQAAQFNAGGLVGLFARRYNKAYKVRGEDNVLSIFGEHVNSSWYGYDAAVGALKELAGVNGELHIATPVAADAVVATATANNGASDPCFKVESAYEEELDYGADGNRTGYTVAVAARVSSLLTAIATAATSIVVASTNGFYVGDLVKLGSTYSTVISIDVPGLTIEVADALTGAVSDPFEAMGFQISVFRRTVDGRIVQVESELTEVVCSPNAAVVPFFVENVWDVSKYVKITYLGGAELLIDKLPAAVTTTTFLTLGSYGTVDVDSTTDWGAALALLDNLPVRGIACSDSTDVAVNKAGQLYCAGRQNDNPMWFYNWPANLSKAQLITLGNQYQAGGWVYGKGYGNWLVVSDNWFGGKLRNVPNVGDVLGQWLAVINVYGIHYSQAIAQRSLSRPSDIVGFDAASDADRTDLANVGVNVIRKVAGRGIYPGNSFTMSSDEAYRFDVAAQMKAYFKISFLASLVPSENKPNTITRIKAYKDAMLRFYYGVWLSGSSGGSPEGESFGRFENDDGTLSQPSQHFEVVADVINNPVANLQLGQADYDSWFTFPSPQGSIRVGLGILRL